jgi:hypothetical protein
MPRQIKGEREKAVLKEEKFIKRGVESIPCDFVAQVDGRNFCQGPRSASSRRVQAAPRSEGKKCWASQIPSTTHTGAPEARLRCSSRHGRKGRLWRELDLRRDVLHNL